MKKVLKVLEVDFDFVYLVQLFMEGILEPYVLNTVALMIEVLSKQELKREYKEVLNEFLPLLLDKYKNNECVKYIIKLSKYTSIPINTIQRIFIITNYKAVALSAIKTLHHIDPNMSFYYSFIEHIKNNQLSVIVLYKVSLISCYCNINQLFHLEQNIFSSFYNTIDFSNTQSTCMKLKCLFNANANGLLQTNTNPSILSKFRKQIVMTYLNCLEQENKTISTKAFILLTRLLAINTTEYIDVINPMVKYILSKCIDIRLHKKVRSSIELLLLTNVRVFNSKLLMLYLVMYTAESINLVKEFLLKMKNKISDKVIYLWIKSAIMYSLSYEPSTNRAKTLMHGLVLTVNDTKAHEWLLLELLRCCKVNTPLLEVVAIGVSAKIISRSKLINLYKVFERYVKDKENDYIKEFKRHLGGEIERTEREQTELSQIEENDEQSPFTQ